MPKCCAIGTAVINTLGIRNSFSPTPVSCLRELYSSKEQKRTRKEQTQVQFPNSCFFFVFCLLSLSVLDDKASETDIASSSSYDMYPPPHMDDKASETDIASSSSYDMYPPPHMDDKASETDIASSSSYDMYLPPHMDDKASETDIAACFPINCLCL
jgi:hypothetical protein